jgi:hypothetical protein
MGKAPHTAARWLAIAVILFGLLPAGGCRLCADCEDIHYPAYGGAWQRTRRDGGRVGSLFDPAGARVAELVERDEPPKPDILERQRQESRDDEKDDPEAMDDESKPDEEPKEDTEDKLDELRDKQLDDIEQEMEEELRKKSIEDINIRLIPRQAPVLH